MDTTNEPTPVAVSIAQIIDDLEEPRRAREAHHELEEPVRPLRRTA